MVSTSQKERNMRVSPLPDDEGRGRVVNVLGGDIK